MDVFQPAVSANQDVRERAWLRAPARETVLQGLLREDSVLRLQLQGEREGRDLLFPLHGAQTGARLRLGEDAAAVERQGPGRQRRQPGRSAVHLGGFTGEGLDGGLSGRAVVLRREWSVDRAHQRVASRLSSGPRLL